MTFYNLARMLSNSTGDSDITLTTAVPGCLTFALAGVSDSEEVHYGLITYDLISHRPVGSEAGIGKYISSGTVFQRNTIEKSTDSDNSAINLTGLSEIYICPIASDFNNGLVPTYSSDSSTYLNGKGEWTTPPGGTGGPSIASYYNGGFDSGIGDSTDNFQLSIGSEYLDPNNMASLSSDEITLTDSGTYVFTASVNVNGSAAMNGYARLHFRLNGSTDLAFKREGLITAGGTVADMNIGPFTYILDAGSRIDLVIDNHTGTELSCGITDITILRFTA